MKAITIVNQVLNALQDVNGTRYQRSDVVFYLREALTMFVHDTHLLKRRIYYTAVEGKDVYMIPDGNYAHPEDYDFEVTSPGTGVAGDTIEVAAAGSDFLLGKVVKLVDTGVTYYYKYLGSRRFFSTGTAFDLTMSDTPTTALQIESITLGSGAFNSDHWVAYTTPEYIKAIRFAWGSSARENTVLTPNSLFNRDTLGFSPAHTGKPTYVFTDTNNFYQFSIWPIPNALAIEQDGKIYLDYVRVADYITDEDSTVDPDIPQTLANSLYTLVCFLLLKDSREGTDAAKAPMFYEMYQKDVLRRTNELTSHVDRYNKVQVGA